VGSIQRCYFHMIEEKYLADNINSANLNEGIWNIILEALNNDNVVFKINCVIVSEYTSGIQYSVIQ